MALCDIHVAGCGEDLPAWGVRDDCIPGTDQSVKGGCHGQKLHSAFPPRQLDAHGSADAEPTTKALCQPPPPPLTPPLSTGLAVPYDALLHPHIRCLCPCNMCILPVSVGGLHQCGLKATFSTTSGPSTAQVRGATWGLGTGS